MALCRYHYPTKLQKLQNQVAGVATNSCFDAPSEPLIQELSSLTIVQLIQLEIVKVAYKALYNEAPLYMEEMFCKQSKTQSGSYIISQLILHSPNGTCMDLNGT